MSNLGCINGTLAVADSYSSPVPIIGLYVAATSLVCMLMMLYDIVRGFRAHKRWLPCKLFALNSVTLTLLSIATKLPVDLTTQMPSPPDQFSKLSGTALICTVMGFFAPSVGITNKSEGFANMAALTIFVITVVVNICIQISTGVIVLFVPEHIITLSCMLLLLMILWTSSSNMAYLKIISADENKRFLDAVDGPLLRRLKYCQMSTYKTNLQFVACKLPSNAVTGALCLVSLVALVQAAVRCLILKQLEFCDGNSDYGWSMVPIVVAQILTVMVGSVAINFRWLAMFRFTHLHMMADAEKDDGSSMKSPILGELSILGRYKRFLLMPFVTAVVVLEYLVISFPMMVYSRLGLTSEECSMLGIIYGVDDWTKQKGKEERQRLRDTSRREFPKHLFQLFSKASYSQQLHTLKLRYQSIDVSSLTIVLVLRVAQFHLPPKLSTSLVQAFIEVKELLHFIDKTLRPKTFFSDNRSLLAKAVWAGDEFNSCYRIVPDCEDIFTELKDACNVHSLPPTVALELWIVLKLITSTKSSSSKDLHSILEETFVEMLHVLLAKLPCAIYVSLNESPSEVFQERVSFALQQLFKMTRFEDQIQWSFPEDSGINRLIHKESGDDSDCNFSSDNVSDDIDQVDVTDNVSTNDDETLPVNLPTGTEGGDVNVTLVVE